MNRNSRNIKFLLILVLAFLMPASLFAQFGTLYNVSQNLSSSYVNQVYQDKMGFVWVSTEDGLNRYDGYTFLRFGPQDGLMSDNITCVIEDRNNFLYVGTSNGIYVKVKGKFRQLNVVSTGKIIPFYVNAFCEAPDGTIVFSTSGRGIWKITDVDKVQNIHPGAGAGQFVTQLLFDKKGILWCVSEKRGIASFSPMKPKNFDGLKLFKPEVFSDSRGSFSEIWKREELREWGLFFEVIQENESVSRRGVMRGLHFQAAPFGQSKLIRVPHGRVFDVVVDLRRSSSTFGKHFSVELSSENHLQLFVPRGFAHGFAVLSDEAVFSYKVDSPWTPNAERCIRLDDPAIAIEWPIPPGERILSEKDSRGIFLREWIQGNEEAE